VLDFLIISGVIFLVVRQFNKLRERMKKAEAAAEPAPARKTCPECLSEVPVAAKKCKYCTSPLHH